MEALLFFRNAGRSPVLEGRVSERLDDVIASHACFSDRRKRQARRGGGGRSRGSCMGGHPQMHQSRSMPLMITGGSPSERSIRSDLNKLSAGNYGSISRRLRLLADADNLTFTFRTALEKAYIEPQHNALYVALFADLLESLGGEARTLAVAIFRREIPSDGVLKTEALRPYTDPARDYDQFCDACKIKRRIVGRSSTFASLLDIAEVAVTVDATPEDVYYSHERVMREIIAEGASPGLDTSGAVEIMLDSLAGVVGKRRGLRSAFRSSVEDLGVTAFPSAKCRFKIMDILGR